MIASLKTAIRQRVARKLRLPEIPVALERLSEQGFNPKHIFDVGAYQGDFAALCLEIWPQAEVTCFEPLPHKVKELRARLPNVKVIEGLLGAVECDSVLLHEAETASSVLDEQHSSDFPVSQHAMRMIDSVACASVPPDFLKLDVQGYELEVLKGAEKTLPYIQAILAEVNLIDIHKGVPLLAEIIAWLNQRSFVAFDICGLTRRPLDNALWQCDMIFVPVSSPLRNNKRWC